MISPDTLTVLRDIEEIKRLKAEYCRHIDQKQWDLCRDLFVDDLRVDVSGSVPPPYGIFSDADTWSSYISERLGPALTVHHVSNPEIQLLDENHAHGYWALFDHIEYRRPEGPKGFVGYGYYEDTYRRQGGRWLIESFKVTRITRIAL